MQKRNLLILVSCARMAFHLEVINGPRLPENIDDAMHEWDTETLINTTQDFEQVDAPSISHPEIWEQAAGCFTDVGAAKDSWTKIFSKKPEPRCEGHDEPCILLKTKKPGINCGRQFYICPRPLGPSGSKEKATEWRCGTFVWASDWNSKK